MTRARVTRRSSGAKAKAEMESQIGGRVVKKRRLEKVSAREEREEKAVIKVDLTAGEDVVKRERKRPKVEVAPIEIADDDADDANAGPFPDFARPYEEECRSVTRALVDTHGDPQDVELIHGEDRLQVEVERVSVLDSLVGTILSQNTTDKTSHKAYASLKLNFPTWDLVRTADPALVAESIRVGGLSEIKTKRIQNILNAVWEERNECSLEHLRSMENDEIKKYLSTFKGVGPKTISCVLMFCLEREEFPVDVHVWKIAISLGWVPPKATREQTYEVSPAAPPLAPRSFTHTHPRLSLSLFSWFARTSQHLNRKVPDDCKYRLHVLMVEHGKIYNNDVKHLRPHVKRALEKRK